MSDRKHQELDFLLVQTIVKNYLPFQIVESSDFQKFLYKLNSTYKMPTRKTVSSTLLPQLYATIKERVKEEIKSTDSVCITTDGWSSRANESYLSVTAHYLDNKLELKSSLLECFKYDEKHTANNLAEELHRVLQEWEIDRKIVGVVTDNAPNIVAAVRLTGWKHIPCFAHTLNLIVQQGLQSVKELLIKVKSIVEFFRRSPQACGKLKAMQEQLGEGSLTL